MNRPPIIIITSETLAPCLSGSLAWSGVDWTASGSRFGDWLRIYRRVLSEGNYHLPFHLVLDLYLVLSQGFEVRFRSEKQGDAELDDAGRLRMRYERECLGRLLQAPDVAAAMEIAQTSPRREICLERLLIQVTRHFAPHYPKWMELNPGLLRDLEIPQPGDIDPSGELEAFMDRASSKDLFGEALESFVGEANDHIRWGQLLHEEDRFELSHLEALSTDHLRVGCRQIVEISRRLASLEPLQLDLSNHEDGADTAFVDETHYPTGGLSGLTNRGSFENLVTSELAWLDESAGDVSLFDLRHVEGELLYHLRDSGNLRRKRRTIHFVLDAGAAFETKHRGYDYQYSVLIQGMCLRLLHDLFGLFEMDALRFEFHYLPTGGSREFLESEIGVMRTVLRDFARHDWVRFSTAEGEAISLDAFVDPSRKSYAIIFTGPERIEAWQAGIEALASENSPLCAALVEVDGRGEESAPLRISLPRSGLDLPELSRRKDAVLEMLVGAQPERVV